jgi:microcystin-dependent protein
VQCGGTTSTGAHQSIAGVGTTGQVLTSNGAGALPTFQSAGGGFAAGTALLFKQTAAPTGWTKVTTYNDYALRIVNGTASTGGSVAFTTAFASGLSAGATTLSTAQMPSHTHSTNIYAYSFCPDAGSPSTAPANPSTGGVISTGSAGSSSSHTHTLPSFAVQYVDVIIATKD